MSKATPPLHIIILAAGEGSRMRTSIPKVLHNLCGKPLLQWVLECAQSIDPAAVHVVYGHAGEQIKEQFANYAINWVEQKEQLGTGHAVEQAMPAIPDDADVLILSADVPLIQKETITQLIDVKNEAELVLLVADFENPKGLGRILRDKKNNIIKIVEEADTSEQERNIKEIYSGIMLCSAEQLRNCLSQLQSHNAQGEFYLTDIIALAVKEKRIINSIHAESPEQVCGINNLQELAKLERYWQRQQAQMFLKAGVRIYEPNHFYLRGNLSCGKDVVIDVNTVIEGTVEIGNAVTIGPNCYLRNVRIANNVTIKANTVIEDAFIGDDCEIGPFARIRPETRLTKKVKIGNFVEVKKSTIDEGSKISHLSYIGDADIAKHVIIGAGTITCNYDGLNKHQTIIKDNVFIGSDTQLVAPVTIGESATIAAGSTIRKDAPQGQLTINVVEQKTLPNWRRPSKKKES